MIVAIGRHVKTRSSGICRHKSSRRALRRACPRNGARDTTLFGQCEQATARGAPYLDPLAARGESRGNDVVTGAQDRTLQAMAMGKRKSEQAPMWMATTRS